MHEIYPLESSNSIKNHQTTNNPHYSTISLVNSNKVNSNNNHYTTKRPPTAPPQSYKPVVRPGWELENNHLSSINQANQLHSAHHYGVTNQLDNNFGFYEDPFSPEQGSQYPIASGLVASMESDYSYSDASGAYRPVKGKPF